MSDSLRPAAAADLLGVSVRTVANYEKAGKLTAERTEGGHRRYSRAEVIQLKQELEEGKDAFPKVEIIR